MKPTQVIGDCELYQGDCLEILPQLGKVDAVVTSPPYDNLREYNGCPSVDLLAVIDRLFDVVGGGGVVVWNVADATVDGSETGSSFRQALHAMSCGFLLHDTMVYIRDNVHFPESVRYFNGFEYMFVFSKRSPRTFNPIKDRVNKWAGTTMRGTERVPNGETRQKSGNGKKIQSRGMRFNWWRMTNNQPDIGHPAPMPYAMAHGHVSSWTNHNEVVADPFMGSGTTGVACVKLGRKFIGIELEPKYFDIACERIEKAYEQPDMFVEPPAPKPVQEGLL